VRHTAEQGFAADCQKRSLRSRFRQQLKPSVRQKTDGMMANPGTRKYVIDPRKYRTYRLYTGCLLLFWLIWAPLTAFMTVAAFTAPSPFVLVWLLFGYVGTCVVPYAIFTRHRKHILEVAGESLVVHGTGWLPMSSVHIPKEHLDALTLERYDDGFDRESIYTLNLLQKPGGRPKRIMLASFVHPREKTRLLEEIQVFLHAHGFVLAVKNELAINTQAAPDAPAGG
jgi:hypothetical protein